MGGMVNAAIKSEPNIDVVAGIDKFSAPGNFDFPIFKSFDELSVEADVIIDFSVKEALNSVLEYAIRTKTAAVIATTGFSEGEVALIKAASEKIPVFYTGNFSLGINVMELLVKIAAEKLTDADIEITETHHNKKVDAPSGTACMLLKSVMSAREELSPVYGRHGIVGKRDKSEVGMHSLRGGSVVGKHEVSFFLDGEEIVISHVAESKSLFANGSVKAAMFLKDKSPGLYDMHDMLK